MTETIALIAGPYLLVTGLGFLLSEDFYRRMIIAQSKADPILLNLSGASHFVVGMTVLVNHWRWSTSAEIVVSLVGMAATLKGTGLILAPDRMMKSHQMGRHGLLISGITFLSIGAYLVYIGFFEYALRLSHSF